MLLGQNIKLHTIGLKMSISLKLGQKGTFLCIWAEKVNFYTVGPKMLIFVQLGRKGKLLLIFTTVREDFLPRDLLAIHIQRRHGNHKTLQRIPNNCVIIEPPFNTTRKHV